MCYNYKQMGWFILCDNTQPWDKSGRHLVLLVLFYLDIQCQYSDPPPPHVCHFVYSTPKGIYPGKIQVRFPEKGQLWPTQPRLVAVVCSQMHISFGSAVRTMPFCNQLKDEMCIMEKWRNLLFNSNHYAAVCHLYHFFFFSKTIFATTKTKWGTVLLSKMNPMTWKASNRRYLSNSIQM